MLLIVDVNSTDFQILKIPNYERDAVDDNYITWFQLDFQKRLHLGLNNGALLIPDLWFNI